MVVKRRGLTTDKKKRGEGDEKIPKESTAGGGVTKRESRRARWTNSHRDFKRKKKLGCSGKSDDREGGERVRSCISNPQSPSGRGEG